MPKPSQGCFINRQSEKGAMALSSEVKKSEKHLDPRKQSILRAVVNDYVETAEPVGSKALLARHSLGVSSATVRNEMAELEEMGYLEQPHTSAGRVPSDKGYRAYVDEIEEPVKLSPTETRKIREEIGEDLSEIRELIGRAAKSLSEQTNFTSLVLTPTYGESRLRQVKILMIEPGKALVIVVLSAGVVRDRLIHIPDLLDNEQLGNLAETLEKALVGKKLHDITLLAVTDAGKREPIPDSLLNQVLFETYIAIKQAENIDLYIEGQHRLLKQPEFADVDKAHRYLDTMSKEGVVAGYLSEMPDTEASEEDKMPAYVVRIGQEIALKGMEDCSFISSSYRIGDNICGKIAVVGPRRMMYSKIISDVSFVNYTLNKMIRRWEARGKAVEEEKHES